MGLVQISGIWPKESLRHDYEETPLHDVCKVHRACFIRTGSIVWETMFRLGRKAKYNSTVLLQSTQNVFNKNGLYWLRSHAQDSERTTSLEETTLHIQYFFGAFLWALGCCVLLQSVALKRSEQRIGKIVKITYLYLSLMWPLAVSGRKFFCRLEADTQEYRCTRREG